MKEFLALIVVVVLTGIIYWGVEPFAHGQMYPKVAPADYTFADLKPLVAEGNAAMVKKLSMQIVLRATLSNPKVWNLHLLQKMPLRLMVLFHRIYLLLD